MDRDPSHLYCVIIHKNIELDDMDLKGSDALVMEMQSS